MDTNRWTCILFPTFSGHSVQIWVIFGWKLDFGLPAIFYPANSIHLVSQVCDYPPGIRPSRDALYHIHQAPLRTDMLCISTAAAEEKWPYFKMPTGCQNTSRAVMTSLCSRIFSLYIRLYSQYHVTYCSLCLRSELCSIKFKQLLRLLETLRENPIKPRRQGEVETASPLAWRSSADSVYASAGNF